MDFAVSESLDLKYEPTRSHQLGAVGKGDSISKNYLNKNKNHFHKFGEENYVYEGLNPYIRSLN